ncbi:MAG: hypothetical protein Q4Q62_06580 [Thermoplasmata archaeon]|nr:hypothetical protein [Thermoplasmata archaeon]
MKLAIAMIIVVTMTPLVVGMVQTAEDSMTSIAAESEARRMADAMQSAYLEGIGTEITVIVTVPSGESIEVGGSDGDEYVIRIVDASGDVSRSILTPLSIPVLCDKVTISGTATVRIACEMVGGVYGITVSV